MADTTEETAAATATDTTNTTATGDDEKAIGDTDASGGDTTTTEEVVDPQSTTPQQQRVLMKKVGYKMQQTGEYWYPVSKKWYTSWINYTCFSKADDDIPGGLENLGKGDVPRPGPIDNSDLADPEVEGQLKKEIEEHLTHEWVHSEKWDLLQSWYGGGPAFPRKVYERGNNREKYICVHPRLVKIITVNEESNNKINEDKCSQKGFPLDYQLKSMAEDLEKEIPEVEEEEQDEKEQQRRNNGGRNQQKQDDIPKVHLWTRFEAVKGIYPINKRITVTEEDLKDEDPQRWVEVPDDYLRTKLDDMKFPDDKAEIVVEYRNKDGTWPLAKSEDDWKNFQVGDIIDCIDAQQGWYECVLRLVGTGDKEGQLAVHYIGWAIKWDEWVPIESNPQRILKRNTESKGPHRPRRNRGGGGGGHYGGYSFSYHTHDEGRPSQSGVVGLRNLGNTCFMNSTLQCLAQSPWLTQDYFLSGEFVHHINKKNPLGWRGKVATAWAHLMTDMFSDKYRVIAPREFKDAIGEVAPRFMGYAQQDSQELLSFLLDGLHEDLNQIIDKPVTESVESNGREDSVVALESWRTYLKRNQSIIVDLMQGQLKSRVECPDCPRVSITFDPYMFLSVPLPTAKYKTVEFTYVGQDVSKPIVYGIKMHKYGDIGMLKDKISRQFNISKEELFICDIWKSNIHREYRRKDSIADFNRKSDDIFVYYSPRRDDGQTNNGNNGNDTNNNNNNNGNDAEQAADETDLPQHGVVDDDAQGQQNNGAGAGDVPAGETRQQDQQTNNNSNNNNNNEAKWQTFVLIFQRQVRRQQYQYSHRQSEDEQMGYPLLVTFNLQNRITMKQVRDRVWELTKPFIRDTNIDINGNPQELPFSMHASWGFNNATQLTNVDEVIDLNQRNMKFIVHFRDPQQFNGEGYEKKNRSRDSSAPAPIDPRTGRAQDDDDDGYGKAIKLEACIDAYIEEEILGEEDAWYCNKCKEHKMAKKKLDLWSTPDLLIIHLKRFSYTRQWRDRINTLVKFPIEGLDLKEYVVDPESKKLAQYDLYAISNHMGGLGGGHYTAYAKNLFNNKWYHLDDSRASEVHNLDSMVSSAAYVLYYRRRYPAKIKHRASRILLPDEKVVNELNNPDQ